MRKSETMKFCFNDFFGIINKSKTENWMWWCLERVDRELFYISKRQLRYKCVRSSENKFKDKSTLRFAVKSILDPIIDNKDSKSNKKFNKAYQTYNYVF